MGDWYDPGHRKAFDHVLYYRLSVRESRLCQQCFKQADVNALLARRFVYRLYMRRYLLPGLQGFATKTLCQFPDVCQASSDYGDVVVWVQSRQVFSRLLDLSREL